MGYLPNFKLVKGGFIANIGIIDSEITLAIDYLKRETRPAEIRRKANAYKPIRHYFAGDHSLAIGGQTSIKGNLTLGGVCIHGAQLISKQLGESPLHLIVEHRVGDRLGQDVHPIM